MHIQNIIWNRNTETCTTIKECLKTMYFPTLLFLYKEALYPYNDGYVAENTETCKTIKQCLLTMYILHFYFLLKKHFYSYNETYIAQN